MSRKPKYSKEVKVQACENYIAGNVSFYNIAKSIGCTKERVRQWYLKYEIHGSKAFDVLDRNRSYSKEFKLSVVDQYLTGNYSIPDLCAKYNIGDAMVSNWINKYNNGIELNNYDPKGEVYTMKSRKTTFKERLEIVKWVIENDMSYKNAADKYSVAYPLVYKWTKAYMSEGPEALKHKKRGPKSKSEVDESNLTEIQKLELELEREKALRKRREFELEILKKKEEFEKQLRSRK